MNDTFVGSNFRRLFFLIGDPSRHIETEKQTP